MSTVEDRVNELSKHLRTVHFAVVIVSVGLLIALFLDSPTVVNRAYDQLRSIMDGVHNWDPGFLEKHAAKFIAREGSPRIALDHELNLRFTENDKTLRVEIERPVWTLWSPNHYPNMVEKKQKRRNALRIKRPKNIEEFKLIWNRLNEPSFIYVPTVIAGEALVVDIGPRYKYKELSKWKSIIVENSVNTTDDRDEKNAWKGTILPLSSDYDANTSKNIRTLIEEKYPSSEYMHFIAARVGGLFDLVGNQLFVPIAVHSQPIDARQALNDQLGAAWHRGTFDISFSELAIVTKEYQGLEFDSAERVLAGERQRGGHQFEALGLKVLAEVIGAWGLPILAVIQLYFLMHLRELRRRYLEITYASTWVVPSTPWIGLYPEFLPRVMLIVSVIGLPWLVCGLVARRSFVSESSFTIELLSVALSVGMSTAIGVLTAWTVLNLWSTMKVTVDANPS